MSSSSRGGAEARREGNLSVSFILFFTHPLSTPYIRDRMAKVGVFAIVTALVVSQLLNSTLQPDNSSIPPRLIINSAVEC